MLKITTYEFGVVKKTELWFYKGEVAEQSPYTSYCYAVLKPLADIANELIEFTTLLDLHESEETIYNKISRTFRYHIRKANTLQLGYKCTFDPSSDECLALIDKYTVFAAKKNLSPIRKKRILALQKQGRLVITETFQDKKLIVTHAYLHDDERILLMHTFHEDASNLNNFEGYANKYHHWNDIVTFKKKGFQTYDFGGIDQLKLPGISKFKLSFGGRIEQTNSYTVIGPALKIAYKCFKLISRK